MSTRTENRKENKMLQKKIIKKILLLVVLLVIVGGIGYVINQKPYSEKEEITSNSLAPQRSEDITEENVMETSNVETIVKGSGEGLDTNAKNRKGNKEVTIKELTDGRLYSLVGDNTVKRDIVIGDNYFDTQLSDIYTNFSEYEGKTIEIEGFYLDDIPNTPYTFIARYSENNLCAYCPVGYSYFEYEWHGNQELNFTKEKEWLKVVGTICKGEDDGQTYYYIDAQTIEVMNEAGMKTVKN